MTEPANRQCAATSAVTGHLAFARAAVGLVAALLLVQLISLSVADPRRRGPVPLSADLPLRLNPNTATAAELELLPRIGPKLAENIIRYRTTAAAQPAFRCAEDLDNVSRIGPATVELLRPFLYFSDTLPASGTDTLPQNSSTENNVGDDQPAAGEEAP